MIHGYLREIDDLVATKELQIHLAIQSPAFINGNKLLIEKVFSNLISNAVKYSPHGASVDIILQNTNGRFLFSVENTGTHIPEDDIPKLFDAFYRMEQSRSRRTGGSGLGLYMVQRMEMSRNVQSGNTQNLKSMVIQRSFPKWSVAERRKTAAASDQAAVCACAHSRYFTGGSPSGLRV